MYCVVMGDIINSRELSEETRQNAKRAAQSAFDRINTDYMSSLMAEFGMVRGDAFEGVILTQSYAPQIVQDIIKAFYSAEKTTVRISVVLGELTITDNDRNKTDGPAFHRALEKLAEMKKKNNTHWLQVSFDIGHLTQGLVDGHMALLTALTEGWTDKQREVVWAMEDYDNAQNVVAHKLKTTTPVISKQLKAANYQSYRRAWEGLTDYLVKMDEYVVNEALPIDKSHIPFFNVALRMAKHHRYFEALTATKKALALADKNLNENDAQYIAIYNLLAEIYTGKKEYKSAEESISESLRIQEQMPKARLEYINTLYIKAMLCRETNNLNDAIKHIEDALIISHITVSTNHRYMELLYVTLARFYYILEDYKSTKELLYKTLPLIDEDKVPLDYARRLYNIADCYYHMGDLSEAISYTKKELHILEKELPPYHRSIILAQNALTQYKSELEATP